MLQPLNNISAYSPASTYSTQSAGSVQPAESSARKSTLIPAKNSSGDNVSISDKAKQLSLVESQKKQIDDKTRDTKPDFLKSPVEKDKNPAETKEISIVEIAKYYPPFLSATRRKDIINKYPFFKDAIDRMTVPPPIDFTGDMRSVAQNDIKSKGEKVFESSELSPA